MYSSLKRKHLNSFTLHSVGFFHTNRWGNRWSKLSLILGDSSLEFKTTNVNKRTSDIQRFKKMQSTFWRHLIIHNVFIHMLVYILWLYNKEQRPALFIFCFFRSHVNE